MINVTTLPNSTTVNAQVSRRPRAVPAHTRSGSTTPMTVGLIATVCMGDLLHELREFLPSARIAFPGIPIHVFTDRVVDAMEIASGTRVGNLQLHLAGDLSGEVSLDRVARHSDYWQPWPILWKIRAMRRCITLLADPVRTGVLIADCDITWRLGFERPFRGDVALSPFYWGRRDIEIPGGGLLQHRDGEFNAGMVVSRSVEFADWWERAYLSGDGGFYEQGCLDMVPTQFTIDYISPLHNYGKWRFTQPHDAVRSYHQHIGERSTRLDVGSLKMAAQRAAAEARSALADNPALRQ